MFLSPNIPDWTPVLALNRDLIRWGYTEYLHEFSKGLDSEFSRMLLREFDRKSWVRTREDWIIAGDGILDDIGKLLFGDFMELFSLHDAKTLWTSLTCVAYKVMYMMTSFEARCDVYLVQ